MQFRQWTLSLGAAAVALSFAIAAQAGPTLDKVKQAGRSSAASIPVSPASRWRTVRAIMPVSMSMSAGRSPPPCSATPSKVKYVPLTAQQRFTALQSGEVDLLSRNTTWTLQRETDLGLNFAPVIYYDGQGFMVAKKLGVKSAKELNGATICVQPGTTTELNLADYFRTNKHRLQAAGHRKARRGRERVLLRPLRRLYDRPLRPRGDPRCARRPTPTTTSSCRR